MSQLRTALRAYAIEGLQPADVVRKLHRLVDHLDEGLGTTLAYLDFDPATRELRYISAGHLPPLSIDAGGRPEFLRGGRSTPLGTLVDGAEVPEASVALGVGERVLLYTDGLVERRDEGIVARLSQLREAAASCARRSRRRARTRHADAHERCGALRRRRAARAAHPRLTRPRRRAAPSRAAPPPARGASGTGGVVRRRRARHARRVWHAPGARVTGGGA